MATTAGTDADDVRVEIDTGLTDQEILDILDRVERDIDREYSNPDFEDTQHRVDFEAVLAALRIAGGRDRRSKSESRESASITFETDTIENLRHRVRRLDPGNTFGRSSSITRDANRHTTTTDS